MKGGGKALWKDENIADSLTTHAIQFIEENKTNLSSSTLPLTTYMFPAFLTTVSEVKPDGIKRRRYRTVRLLCR